MQLKRILVSFLVAVMMISLAIVAASAANENATFGISVESADAEGNIEVTPGDIDVDVKITNNPGVSSINFEVVYDATALTLKGYTFNEDAYSLGELGAVIEVADKDNDGYASVFVFTDPDAKANTATEVIITLHFTVAESFEGTEASVVINPKSLEVFTPNGDQIKDVVTSASCTAGHTAAEVVVENNVDATCAAEGSYDNVVYCSVCDTELSRETVSVEKLDHTAAEAVVENEVAADCVNKGSYDSVVKCADCGEELSRETIAVDALGHKPEFVAGVDATCTDAGKTAGQKCSVCATVLVEQTEIAALGHSFTTYTSNDDATCTANGTETAKCDRCDVTDTRIDADSMKAHTEKDVAAVAPSCTSTGLTAGKVCEVCGVVLTAQEVVAATGHTEVEDAAVAATCTTAGKTAGKHCSVCNVITVAQEAVEALGHTYDNVCDATCNTCEATREIGGHKFADTWTVVVEATEEATGSEERACTVCGEKEIREIPVLPKTGIPAGVIVIIIVLAVLALGGIGTAVFFAVKKKN